MYSAVFWVCALRCWMRKNEEDAEWMIDDKS
jgi:hypothetical protein